MNIFNWLNRNKNNSNLKWEDTEKGKKFYQKYFYDAKKRKLEKEEWEKNTPPERKTQVKLFKIIFTAFYATYVILLLIGFKFCKELWVLLGLGLFSGISLVLFFVKPKVVKYPNCFMMPVLALGCTALLYLYIGIMHGFNPQTRELNKNESALFKPSF
ncbi:hypothetical protein [Treponema pectinovorum]|uniref:hypothetical protein n=1 Tax=Treponema pectinovorum TaxID=164 RepID=UPI0011F33CA0|nr:hypothetical protein [Treponema pectinovorum]